MRWLIAGAWIGLWGCGVEEESTLDWALLEETDHLEREPAIYGGCGDVFMYARSESDRMGMTLSTYGLDTSLIDFAMAAGGTYEVSYELPADGIDIVLQRGRNLSRYWCNDAIYPPLPVILREAYPVSGVLTMQVIAEPDITSSWYTPATATAILEDVVWASEAGAVCEMLPADIEMYDVFVGWLAG